MFVFIRRMWRTLNDDYNVDEVWISVSKAAEMLCGAEEDVHRLVRMRRVASRDSDKSVRLGDIITALGLREFDAVLDSGGTEKQARKRAETLRAKLEAKSSPIQPPPPTPSVPSVLSQQHP